MKIVCHILSLLMLPFPVTGRCVTASENYVRIIIVQTNRYLSGGLPQTGISINDKTTDNHLYCGMQYMGTHSMGFYDNEARIYDALLTRFTTPDPLSEKFPNISPYASRANNPLLFVDEDGRVFTTRSMEHINNLRNTVSSRIAQIQKLQESDQSNDLQTKIDNLKNILEEINQLEVSDVVYDIQMPSSEQGLENMTGESIYDKETGIFHITLDEHNMGLLAHELKHAYQFENGEYAYKIIDKKAAKVSYFLEHEEKAYKVQDLINGTNTTDFQNYPEYKNLDNTKISDGFPALINSAKSPQQVSNRGELIFKFQGVLYKPQKR